MTNEQLTLCESALSADNTIPHKIGLVIHVSGLCLSSATKRVDLGRSEIVADLPISSPFVTEEGERPEMRITKPVLCGIVLLA